MSIIDAARNDLNNIMNDVNFGFTQDVVFTTPDGLITATIKGLVSAHHNAIDADGMEISSKVASVSFMEVTLAAEGYPVRDVDGIVYLENHRLTVLDAVGGTREYIVIERKPDDMLGIIVLILEDFEV
jgi:hypothetical protein